jgi:hypothetical protein
VKTFGVRFRELCNADDDLEAESPYNRLRFSIEEKRYSGAFLGSTALSSYSMACEHGFARLWLKLPSLPFSRNHNTPPHATRPVRQDHRRQIKNFCIKIMGYSPDRCIPHRRTSLQAGISQACVPYRHASYKRASHSGHLAGVHLIQACTS